MENIPTDPVILLSYINTKLRDEYSTFSALCEDLELDSSEIENKLSSIDYHYNPDTNQFT